METPEDDQALRSPLIETFRRRLISKLTETGRNNASLYFRSLKSTLELPGIDDPLIAALIAGRAIRPEEWNPSASTADELKALPDEGVPGKAGPKTVRFRKGPKPGESEDTRRLRTLRAKAQEYYDERGLQTLYVGIGLLTWKAEDGGRDPLALLFVLPVEIIADPKRRGEFLIRKPEGAELGFNPSLLEVLPAQLRAHLDAIAQSEAIGSLVDAFEETRSALLDFPLYTLVSRCVLRTFAFAALALIEDLRKADDLLDGSVLAKAFAGDSEAQLALQRESGECVDQFDLDEIPAARESFILDADPSQAQAIHTILKYETANALWQGPPGTGKSQTIANAIAALIASGKKVLFVAEKRAALEVVQKRLDAVGLGHLILDLHGADVTRNRVYARLREARKQISDTPPPPPFTTEQSFDQARNALNTHANVMNAKLEGAGLSPFELIGRLLALESADIDITWGRATIESMTASSAAQIGAQLDEAASNAEYFMRSPGSRWALATLPTHEAAQGMLVELSSLRERLRSMRAMTESVRAVGDLPENLDELLAAGGELEGLARVMGVFTAEITAIDDVTLRSALAATATPIARLFSAFVPAQRAAMRNVAKFSRGRLERQAMHSALQTTLTLPPMARTNAPKLASRDLPSIEIALREIEHIALLDEALGVPLPRELTALDEELARYLRDAASAFRAARSQTIEASIRAAGAGALIDALRDRSVAPTLWRKAFDAAWLRSQLNRVMSKTAIFDGRRHDQLVDEFAKLDTLRLHTAVQRILRSSAERFIEQSREHPKERAALDVEMARQKKQLPIRDLYAVAPHVLPALVPCVMASPLSVSQLLPRLRLFDIVIFDEGSQVTTESAINAILRAKRLVVAGDEHQLPPSPFFLRNTDEDEDDEDDEGEENAPAPDVLLGTESLLDTVKSFSTVLGLNVHYRSLDERLIAFSNHWIYGDRLITFPGNGTAGTAVRHELVDEPALEGDEGSASAEARRVVDLIIEHAELRAHESLGVIAMGQKHASRIEVALLRARAEHPDLEDFFSEGHTDRFFIKNLERVQGDERDAIILSIGYGRTKKGSISHSFGPVNNEGGERRLNVAITRAKIRITLVTSFRSSDLDQSKLKRTGPKLLARYVRYAESGGDDLGRDGERENVPLNDFEADVKVTLERRLQMQIIGQYGVGPYRIDLAVQDPAAPGAFVLAIECDGASYHSTPTARMRDRLRQQNLESRGWRFVRIWSTDWFERREEEIARIAEIYREALAGDQPAPPATTNEDDGFEVGVPGGFGKRLGRAPSGKVQSIDDLSDRKLQETVRWIQSDGRLRTDDQIMESACEQLGFTRKGSRIVARLQMAIDEIKS